MIVVTIVGIVVILIILIPASIYAFFIGARMYFDWVATRNIRAYQKLTEASLADIQKRYMASAREVDRDLKRLQNELAQIQRQQQAENGPSNT